ncbi:hypothetical protein [Bradyrhizobium sp. WSM2254]|uniref:hypothetical protein n=1 Tax=Bradyrhizobium sp. WSM2254 TaxID=1188263 RepID=UPI0004838D9D|nr:hypothetical protein [Bradyrhizobium sp. WSM2254]
MVEKGPDERGKKPTLKDAIYGHMPLIDTRLAADESLLAVRPFEAAAMFVKDCVFEVSNDPDKDDFAAKPWFAIIYHHVEAWYRETYGDAMKRGAGNVACGVVLVRDLPVELAVPLTRSKVETPGETAWLFFPVTVEQDEDPLDWLMAAPSLATLNKAAKEGVGKDAVAIATALRSIRIDFMGIEPHDDAVFGLLEGVLAEFESAARQMLRAEPTGRASALWTLQMAVERTLKAFAQHKAGTFRQIHNLYELFDDVAGYGTGADRNLLKKLPRDRDVMSDRYGLRGTPTIWETYEAYKAALLLVSSLSRHFKRKINVGGGGVLLRKPPWTTLPSEQTKAEFGKATAGEPSG